MKICIEFGNLEAAARNWGCHNDFSSAGWEYLEDMLDCTLGADEAFCAVGDLKFDYYEQPADSFVRWQKLPAETDADEVLDYLRDNDYITAYYYNEEFDMDLKMFVKTQLVLLNKNYQEDHAPMKELVEVFGGAEEEENA